jgi:formamidopyrimidine-DNA glycosylase
MDFGHHGEAIAKAKVYLGDSARIIVRSDVRFGTRPSKILPAGAVEVVIPARLSPFRSGLSLGNADYRRLAHSLTDVLTRAIAADGSTLDDYRGTSGAMGNFDLSFSVYARGGVTCPRCGSPIATQVMAGRVTYWCPDCQL